MSRVSAPPICVARTGLVTSVGLNAEASCTAMRAKLANPSETRLVNLQGDWIVAHQVTLEKAWRGIDKLVRMAAMALAECLDAAHDIDQIPLLLCVAEPDRPGRLRDLDARLFAELQRLLHTRFSPQSRVIAQGRVGIGVALLQARQLLREGHATQVLVAAADSLVTSAALEAYQRDDRLLTPTNSNGLIAGEGAGALLLTLGETPPALRMRGLGFGVERAHVMAESPLRADGLTQAMQAALAEAGLQLHELDFRITDLSGEQYYFKEAALALGRILRTHKEAFDLWHPAECVGETGAVAGMAAIALADAACRKGFGPGPRILVHAGSDGGQRMAAVFEYGA